MSLRVPLFLATGWQCAARALFALLVLLFVHSAARAENVYIMDIGLQGIYSVDVNYGGPATRLVTITPPANPQGYTLATRPSDGMLFYLDRNTANPNLWRWDPSNPTQPPVLVGTPGATTTDVVRLGFDGLGRLLAMDTTSNIWTLDTVTGGIVTTTPLSGNLPSSSGDLCLNTKTGVLYMVANLQVYTVTAAGVSTLLGTVQGTPSGFITGCAFTADGTMLISMLSGGALLRVNLSTLTATALPQSSGISSIGDLATAPGRSADLSLTKTASNTSPGATTSFTITVSNAGPLRATDVRVQDVLPAGLTMTSWSASQGTYSAAAASPNPAGTWSVGAIDVGGSATLTINVNVAAGTGTITNTAQIYYSDLNDPDSTPNNNVAGEDDQDSVVITRSPDLTIAKVANGSFTRDVTGTYTITVGNIGSAPTSGAITVTDVLASNLNWVSAAGTGWSCSYNAGTRTVTCTSSTAVAAGASANPITLSVKPTSDSPDTAENTASVAGGNEPASNNGNNTSTTTTAVCTTNCPDLRVNKSLSASSLVVGTTRTYTLSVTNIGGLTTGTNAYTVTDQLPAGLTLATVPSGSGWTCTQSAPTNTVNGNNVSCTRSTAILPGGTSTGITFNVNVANTAVPEVVNTARVDGGGEPLAARNNNETTLVTPVTDFDLTVTKAKSGTGNFAVGSNAAYTIYVTNIGTRASTGTTRIDDTLPNGMTIRSTANTNWTIGTGWSCAANTNVTGSNTANGTRISCNYTSSIPANGGTSTAIVVPVTVAAAAAPAVSNTVTVSNPNEAPAYTTNNLFTLVSPVDAPDIAITKSHNGTFAVDATERYTLTATNVGSTTHTGTITVSDVLPAGLTYSSASGTGWTCSYATASRTLTCRSTSSLGASTSANPISLFVIPTAAAVPSVTNTATVVGANEPAGNVGANNSASDVTQVSYPPVISKSFNPTSIQAGRTSTLTITITNPLGSPLASQDGLAFTDPLPAGMSIASPPGLNNTCSGSVGSGAAQGDTIITFSGGSVGGAGSSCSISVRVTSTTVGTANNVTGEVSSTNGGIGNTATAALTVTAPTGSPVLTKVSSPSAVGTGEVANLVFTINNTSSTNNNMRFTDTLPDNVVVAGTATHTCTTNNSNPATSVSATVGGSVITATGIDLNSNATCRITVPVKSNTPGSYVNNSSNISNTATLNVTGVNDTLVVESTTLTKSFTPSAIAVNGTATMALVLTNGPNMPEQNGLAFIETLPAGLVLAQAPAATQCNGAVTGSAGGNTLALSGGMLALGQAGCTVTAVVTATTGGTFDNLDANVTGTSVNIIKAVNATLTVSVPLPTLAKTNNQTVIIPGTTTTYVVTVGNSSGMALTSVVVKDPPVANLTLTGASCAVLGTPAPTCPAQTGAALVTALQGAGGATIPSLPNGGTVVFTINAQLTGSPTGTLTNVVTATVGGQTVTAQDSDAIGYPSLSNMKTVAVLRDPLNGTSNPKAIPGAEAMYTITIVNQGTITLDADSVTVTDTIPPNTELFVGDLGLPLGPIGFSASSAPAAGLTLSWDGTAGDDVDFSNSARPGPYLWTYSPTPNGDGYDPAVTAIRMRPKGSFNGSAAAPRPQVQFQFKVRIK